MNLPDKLYRLHKDYCVYVLTYSLLTPLISNRVGRNFLAEGNLPGRGLVRGVNTPDGFLFGGNDLFKGFLIYSK